MTKIFDVRQDAPQLSDLLDRIQQGEVVLLVKAGRVLAKVVPMEQRPSRRRPGSAKGQIKIADDFDAPLPKGVANSFEA